MCSPPPYPARLVVLIPVVVVVPRQPVVALGIPPFLVVPTFGAAATRPVDILHTRPPASGSADDRRQIEETGAFLVTRVMRYMTLMQRGSSAYSKPPAICGGFQPAVSEKAPEEDFRPVNQKRKYSTQYLLVRHLRLLAPDLGSHHLTMHVLCLPVPGEDRVVSRKEHCQYYEKFKPSF